MNLFSVEAIASLTEFWVRFPQNQGSFRDLGTDFSSKIAPSAMISEKFWSISSKISLDSEGNEPKTQVISAQVVDA